jgi:hypothetical protein
LDSGYFFKLYLKIVNLNHDLYGIIVDSKGIDYNIFDLLVDDKTDSRYDKSFRHIYVFDGAKNTPIYFKIIEKTNFDIDNLVYALK